MPEKTPEEIASDCLIPIWADLAPWMIEPMRAIHNRIVEALRAAHDAALEEAAKVIYGRSRAFRNGSLRDLVIAEVRKLKESQRAEGDRG